MDERYQFTRRPVSGEPTDADRGWVAAMRQGFNQGRADDEQFMRVWRAAVEDGQTWRRIDRSPAVDGLGGANLPVATFATLAKTINVGHGRMSRALYVSDVTVRATDRRQGLLRHMMVDALTQARDEGLTLAALTASEGGIYGRFGFGVALRDEAIELQCTDHFRLALPPGLQVESAEPRDHVELTMRLVDDFHARHRGSHQRMSYHRQLFGGLWDFRKNSEPTALRSLVAIDDGRPVGVLVHEPDGQGATKVLIVVADGAAELALWQQLARTDLVRTANFPLHMPGSPLRSALVDPRVMKTVGGGDWLWLRILDVEKALVERGYDHDGSVVLRVDDPLGLTEGTWRVTVQSGQAEVERVDESEASVRCRVDALAPCWFGDTPVSVLAAAGRITGEPAAVREFGRLMSTNQPPRNLVAF